MQQAARFPPAQPSPPSQGVADQAQVVSASPPPSPDSLHCQESPTRTREHGIPAQRNQNKSAQSKGMKIMPVRSIRTTRCRSGPARRGQTAGRTLPAFTCTNTNLSARTHPAQLPSTSPRRSSTAVGREGEQEGSSTRGTQRQNEKICAKRRDVHCSSLFFWSAVGTV